jgi:hypothetical protein
MLGKKTGRLGAAHSIPWHAGPPEPLTLYHVFAVLVHARIPQSTSVSTFGGLRRNIYLWRIRCIRYEQFDTYF